MKIENKIGILLSWPRELDMYEALIENFSEELVIIIDDFTYTENERSENSNNIIGLIGKKLEYVYLSEILGKLKYKILFSTAQTFQERFTISSYLKYYYAMSIGRFVNFSRMSIFFMKIINRPLTGGGVYAKKFERVQIERKIGIKTVRYPKGLDVSKKVYPAKRWENVFDVHLCHGNLDKDLILKKFSNANCIKIGYPKYDNVQSSIASKKEIVSEFFFSCHNVKPLLLWMPTHIKFESEYFDNINIWLPVIEQVLKKYNVLIRPHPKSIAINPKIVTKLKNKGFGVDIKRNRELKSLYQSADLILADYGGSVLSSIYMRKKIILLNMPSSSEYAHWRENGEYVDHDVRGYVDNFYLNNKKHLIKKIDDLVDSTDNTTNSLKTKYFGNVNVNIVDILSKLSGEVLHKH